MSMSQPEKQPENSTSHSTDHNMNLINLWRPDLEIAGKDEVEVSYDVDTFGMYGRDHETKNAVASVGITRLQDGVYLDLDVRCEVETTCDRTLEPVTLSLAFGDAELLSDPSEPDLGVRDWVLDVAEYTRRALPAEIPIQVFAPGTEAVDPESEEDEIDPRWRGLDGLFASGF